MKENNMDEDRNNLILETLIENVGDKKIEFVRNNMLELKEKSAILYENIIAINPVDIEYVNYYSVYDSISLAREFLEYINPKYSIEFDKLISNGSFDIISEHDEEDDAYVDSEILDDETIRHDIHIPLKHNLDDVYALVHEFFHTTNIENFETLDRDMLTESVSIFYEFLLHDFLKDKNVKKEDNDASIRFRLNQILDDCYDLNYLLDEIYDALDSINFDFESHSEEEIQEVYEELDGDIRYFVSSLIAILKYYDYKNGMIGLKHIEEYNESLKQSDGFTSLNYIFIRDISEEDIIRSCELLKNELKTNEKVKNMEI